jgi:hypothetical protein
VLVSDLLFLKQGSMRAQKEEVAGAELMTHQQKNLQLAEV